MAIQALENNNPGNIRPKPTGTWHGQTNVSNGFAVFDSDVNGIRAMAHQLTYYFRHYGYNTIRKIIDQYDYAGNTGYINQVSQAIGQGPDTVLDLDRTTITDLIDAMIAVEMGNDSNQITQEDINNGIDLAEGDNPNLYTLPTTTQPTPQQQQPPPAPKQPAIPTEAGIFDIKLPALPAAVQAAGIEWWEIGVVAALVLIFVRTRSNYYN